MNPFPLPMQEQFPRETRTAGSITQVLASSHARVRAENRAQQMLRTLEVLRTVDVCGVVPV